MSDTLFSIILSIHVLFIAVWVGAQILIAMAVVPALRDITDDLTRLDTMHRFTRRFNVLAWGSALIILLTGSVMATDRVDTIELFAEDIFDVRWGALFVSKMTLLIPMVVAIALHSFVVGPRLMRAQRDAAEGVALGDADALKRLRALSVSLSVIGLLLSIALLVLGAFLSNQEFSFAAT